MHTHCGGEVEVNDTDTFLGEWLRNVWHFLHMRRGIAWTLHYPRVQVSLDHLWGEHLHRYLELEILLVPGIARWIDITAHLHQPHEILHHAYHRLSLPPIKGWGQKQMCMDYSPVFRWSWKWLLSPPRVRFCTAFYCVLHLWHKARRRFSSKEDENVSLAISLGIERTRRWLITWRGL